MATAKNRGRCDRRKLRYPSDVTDDEWAHVEPMFLPAKRGGNKRHVDVREGMNGIMDILRPGCPWRSLSILPCWNRQRRNVCQESARRR
jgi:transposase